MAITDWDITIEGTDVPRLGRKTQIKEVENIRSARTADGTLKQDVIYTKKEILFSYDKIPESTLVQLQTWREAYLADLEPLELIYTEPGATSTTTLNMVPGPIDFSLMTIASDNLYSGVKFRLVET